MGRTCIAMFLSTFFVLVTAGLAAAEPPATMPADSPVTLSPTMDVLLSNIFAPNLAFAGDVPAVAPRRFVEPTPSLLRSTYVGLAALQAYDTYSTLTALHNGAVEANPVIRGVSGNPTALLAVKGAATFGVIYVAERLWRERHRGAAIALMAATNATMAVVAAHNASVLRGQR